MFFVNAVHKKKKKKKQCDFSYKFDDICVKNKLRLELKRSLQEIKKEENCARTKNRNVI